MTGLVGVNVVELPPPLGAAVQPATTSVTGVLGVFERGVPHRPVRLTGPEQVAPVLGQPRSDAVAALALRLYFMNGGREVVAVRVVGAGASPASLVLDDAQDSPQAGLRLRAGDRGREDPGLWGRRLSASVATAPSYTGTLAADAGAGDTTITLTDSTGVAAGQTLRVFDDSGGGAPVVARVRVTTVNSRTGVVTFAPALGNALSAAGTVVSGVEVRLRIFYRITTDVPAEVVEDWPGLTLTRDTPGYAPDLLNDPITGSRFVTAEDLRPADAPPERDGLGSVAETDLVGGSEPAPTALDYTGTAATRTGLHAFDQQAVQLLTLPDVHSLSDANRRTTVRAAIAYCAARNDCMVIAALPDRSGAMVAKPQGPGHYAQSEADYVAAITAYTADFREAKSFGAFYGPFGATLDPTATGPARLRMIPLCLPIAGVYADVALRRGVAAPPAGAGATLRGIQALSAHLSEVQNTAVVRRALANMARQDALLGLHVATSRTASTDVRWQFVNVRLLFNFVVASLRQGLRGFVHEIHDARLQRRAVASVTDFLEELRRRGAFAFMDAERAYRVKADADNNPPAAVARGELNLDVEINPAKPAEQILLRVGVSPRGVSLSES